MTDRDVILVNTRAKGLSYKKKSVKSACTRLSRPSRSVAGPFSAVAGSTRTDDLQKGAKFRLANTHLEVGGESEAIQQKEGKGVRQGCRSRRAPDGGRDRRLQH